MAKVLGVEFAGSQMVWVLVDEDPISSGNLKLTATRDNKAMAEFRASLDALLEQLNPDVIAVKEKPESGRMQAGGAALKMEGVLLSIATAEFDFVSGRRINAILDAAEGLKEKEKVAYKAAISALKNIKA